VKRETEVDDRRVVFDFEIDFSNGGGIQGQDFRLDIDGDEIGDEALAAHIVRELNLLMVGAVRIIRKTVVAERHKRTVAPAASGAATPEGQAIDLSHTIESGMITYQGLPAPLICDHLSRVQSRGLYAPGTEFQIDRLEMVGNTGTYLDTPYHRFADGADLAAIGLERVAGLPGVVVRVTGMEGRAIEWTHFVPVPVAGRAVLVHTGWDARWRTDRYFEGHPFLTRRAAEYLRDQGAALVGIDSLNIDDTADLERPVHTVLLGAGIPIVEHLTRLAALPAEGFRFFAVPPKVERMGTFPVRAHARLESAAGA
jgi:arylformamidase